MLVTVFLPSKKSTSATPSESQKTVAISFLTDLLDLNLIGPDDPPGNHCLDLFCFRIILIHPCFISCDNLIKKAVFSCFNFEQTHHWQFTSEIELIWAQCFWHPLRQKLAEAYFVMQNQMSWTNWYAHGLSYLVNHPSSLTKFLTKSIFLLFFEVVGLPRPSSSSTASLSSQNLSIHFQTQVFLKHHLYKWSAELEWSLFFSNQASPKIWCRFLPPNPYASWVKKTTWNKLALGNFVYKRKMSDSKYLITYNMLFMASMLKYVFSSWHSCHGRIPHIFWMPLV